MDANIVKSPFPDIDIPEIPLHFWLFKKFSENVNNVALVCIKLYLFIVCIFYIFPNPDLNEDRHTIHK